MNWIGIVAALAAFLGIWVGHVSVRKAEASAARLWMPVTIAVALGLGLEAWSLITQSPLWSTALGILGMTVLWDALELFRQERRVKHGHAPANPGNPRHARILSEYPSATTADVLKREPAGFPVFVTGE